VDGGGNWTADYVDAHNGGYSIAAGTGAVTLDAECEADGAFFDCETSGDISY